EWLGRNTPEYSAMLAETGQGRWNHRGDARPWLRFCLKAHYQQAATLIRRNEEYGRLFEGIEALQRAHRLPERAQVPLFNAALGFRLTNRLYRSEADVSELVASRDLKRLCDAGLLLAKGERRGRHYLRADQLVRLREECRITRSLGDPYAVAMAETQTPPLPFD
ncbi:MAG: hypothetical protein ACKVPY_09700, partial [Paracoccaceae bacterium]